MVKKNYVVFMSAGTFVSESTQKEIDEWDVNKAIEMSKQIVERYGSRPYGFHFIARGRDDSDLDSKVISTSGMYYINGVVSTLNEIKARHDLKDSILISNMECNEWNKVIRTSPPWNWTLPFNDDDVVLTV